MMSGSNLASNPLINHRNPYNYMLNNPNGAELNLRTSRTLNGGNGYASDDFDDDEDFDNVFIQSSIMSNKTKTNNLIMTSAVIKVEPNKNILDDGVDEEDRNSLTKDPALHTQFILMSDNDDDELQSNNNDHIINQQQNIITIDNLIDNFNDNIDENDENYYECNQNNNFDNLNHLPVVNLDHITKPVSSSNLTIQQSNNCSKFIKQKRKSPNKYTNTINSQQLNRRASYFTDDDNFIDLIDSNNIDLNSIEANNVNYEDNNDFFQIHEESLSKKNKRLKLFHHNQPQQTQQHVLSKINQQIIDFKPNNSSNSSQLQLQVLCTGEY